MKTNDTNLSKPVLSLEKVRKTFGEFIALKEVNLRVNKGSVFGLLGPNGAGKTTTLRLITGLIQPTSGSVNVCGFDVTSQSLETKRRIGFISDRPYLYDKLTAAEFLRFVGGLWGMSKREIVQASEKWLEEFDLGGWAGEPVESFSHGMKQRLLFCSALLHSPELFILDEPMVGLDPRGAVKLKQLLRQLAADGTTIILSTHTLDVVEQVCDYVGIIDRGQVIANGTLAELRENHLSANARLEDLFLKLTHESTRTSDTP